MIPPLISILTPTYNHERFIGECIESVLSQTYPSWEQIIVDDGSADGTAEVVAGYDDDRIRFIKQENVGIWRLGETYNKALRVSSGKFIAILEGDDFWPDHKLERQMPAFDRPGVVVSFGRAAITDSVGKVLGVYPKDLRPFMDMPEVGALKTLLFQNPITACTAMCRKDALLSIGGFKQPRKVPYVDGPTWLDLSLVGKFQPLDEILGCYRQHGMQVTSTMRSDMVDASEYVLEFFSKLSPDVRSHLGIKAEDLVANIDRKRADKFYFSGRAALKAGRWSDAESDFKRALTKGSASVKAKAILGLACGMCRTDMEGIIAMAKRGRP